VLYSAAKLESVHVEVLCERLRTGGAHDVLTAPHGPIELQRVANKAKNALLIAHAVATTKTTARASICPLDSFHLTTAA
jgi:hypothetical protein